MIEYLFSLVFRGFLGVFLGVELHGYYPIGKERSNVIRQKNRWFYAE